MCATREGLRRPLRLRSGQARRDAIPPSHSVPTVQTPGYYQASYGRLAFPIWGSCGHNRIDPEGAPSKLRLGGGFLWRSEVKKSHTNVAQIATLVWGTRLGDSLSMIGSQRPHPLSQRTRKKGGAPAPVRSVRAVTWECDWGHRFWVIFVEDVK